MTLVDPTTGGPRGRSRSTSTAGGVSGRLAWVWPTLWLIGVPILVAAYVDSKAGDAWGAIPAFWLGGDPTPAGPNVAAVLALVATFGVCLALRIKRADVLLGVIPAAVTLTAHVTFDAALIGLLVGLAVGGIWYALRRRQGR